MSEVIGFSERIKRLRKKKCMTQTELANLVKVSLPTVSRWESGERQPRADELRRLCEVLGCSETELLNGEKSKERKITLSYDWEEYEKGEVNMSGEGYELFLGANGAVGLKGSRFLTSEKVVENVLAQLRVDLMAAFNAQKARGLIEVNKDGTK